MIATDNAWSNVCNLRTCRNDDDDGKLTKKKVNYNVGFNILNHDTVNLQHKLRASRHWCTPLSVRTFKSTINGKTLHTVGANIPRTWEYSSRVFYTLDTRCPSFARLSFHCQKWHLFFQYQRSLLENVFSENTLCLGHPPHVTQLKIRNLLAPSAGFWQPFQDACTVWRAHAPIILQPNHYAKWNIFTRLQISTSICICTQCFSKYGLKHRMPSAERKPYWVIATNTQT